ncbi:Hypothetical protein CGLY_16715 (plasmid) [Corynebacterium glyciniphilum AJ 3170]|uniref:Uncharacterized protein n=1 Tax=Corynebacterium glyciniphilum AJ 3170 TaxID=1404245 RepID=X5EGL3_9CORY|nr:Hypothetical protein CGLY_16715 [Corynebacterium glyciniphilum AJ 3170]
MTRVAPLSNTRLGRTKTRHQAGIWTLFLRSLLGASQPFQPSFPCDEQLHGK